MTGKQYFWVLLIFIGVLWLLGAPIWQAVVASFVILELDSIAQK